jgi:catechol 2,3-dioxygenase-like lactoylglutathione lyase family enzyme
VTHVLDHMGLTVSDLDRSIAFYCDVVGMEFQKRGFKTGGEWFDTLTNNSGAVIDAARVGFDGFCLQLVQYQEGSGGTALNGHNRVGNPHLCIRVPDVDEKRRQVVASGDHRATPIVEVAGGPARSFYISDPDGTPIEFIQLRP